MEDERSGAFCGNAPGFTHNREALAPLLLALCVTLELNIAREVAGRANALIQAVAEDAGLEVLSNLQQSPPDTPVRSFLDRVFCLPCPDGNAVELRTCRQDNACHELGRNIGAIARLRRFESLANR